jgi:hypothetical protein
LTADRSDRHSHRGAGAASRTRRSHAHQKTRPGWNNALNHAAWTLGRWIAAGALEQSDVEEALYAAAVQNGLVADDGERQCWATIRSGSSAVLQKPADLNARRN